VLTSFENHVTVANLNYDTLVLSVLAERYGDILSDMANGRYAAGSVRVGGVKYPVLRLRATEAEFMPLERRRLRLLHLHGSLTFWRFGVDNYGSSLSTPFAVLFGRHIEMKIPLAGNR
jgi:hypothetical protein